MSEWVWLRGPLLAVALLNVGLTVWHFRILRRARRYQADTVRLHEEALALVEELQAAAVPFVPTITDPSNGKREPVDHKEGPEP